MVGFHVLHPGRLTAGSPTAISHEKKGKWSEPNLHEDMFHVNLPGCTFSWTYWKSVVVYFLTWDENHHCSLPFKMWGVLVGELFRSIEEANPSNTETENKHGKLFWGASWAVGCQKKSWNEKLSMEALNLHDPDFFQAATEGLRAGQCFQQSWWWSFWSSHSWEAANTGGQLHRHESELCVRKGDCGHILQHRKSVPNAKHLQASDFGLPWALWCFTPAD